MMGPFIADYTVWVFLIIEVCGLELLTTSSFEVWWVAVSLIFTLLLKISNQLPNRGFFMRLVHTELSTIKMQPNTIKPGAIYLEHMMFLRKCNRNL